jgi:Cupin domain
VVVPAAAVAEVLEGALGLRVGDDQLIARPGDTITVPPGTPHGFHNPGDREARSLCEIHPALGFESLIETMFTLATDGKTNRKGMPNPLRLAVIAKAHFETVPLPLAPDFVQRAALAIGDLLGRLAGYKPTYAVHAPRTRLAPA